MLVAQGSDDIVALLRNAFREARDAAGVSERNVIVVANPALVRLLGYEREEELLGRTFLDLLDPAELPKVHEYVRRRAEGGSVPGLYTWRAFRRDGSRFDMEVRTTSFEHGGRTFALAMVRDATADADADDLYDAFFQRNTAVKLLIDPADGRIVDANAAAERFYGWSLDELREMRMAQINLLPQPDISRLMHRARDGRQRYFQFRHRVADGSDRDVEIHSGPVEIGGRRLLLSIVHDLSDRRDLEDRLRQAQQLEAIGRLAGGVAHDFNNLLTIVQGCAELLRPHLAPDGERYLEDLLGAAHRAGALTQQLLAVGRRQELAPRPVRLDEVVRGAEPLLRRAVGPEVDLDLRLAPGLVVHVDPSQIEQVLLNLVLNAAEAMDGRGAVRVELASGRDDSFGSPFAVLRVVDTGHGMDPATLAHVFEPFFTTKGGRGTGLGLPSVHGIVSQSGGHVDVQSEPGRGTTFSVWLPVRGDDLEPPRPLVWVVDDEDDLREILVETLTRAGWRVAPFASAEEALAALGLEEVAAVVTDQVMPGRSGVQLATALRERRPELPVLLVSGDAVFAASVAAQPAWPFLRKPFSGAELVRRVAGLVAR